MRILLIDVNCKENSTGKLVYQIYNYLLHNDDEAYICYGRGIKIKENGIYKFGLDLETYLHALFTRITGFTGCFSLLSTIRLIKYIEKVKPDIVHIHEIHGYFVNIDHLLKYLSSKKIPVVLTLHCEFMYTGKCGYAIDCNNWKIGCGDCPRISDYPKSLYFDNTRKMFSKKIKAINMIEKIIITTVSPWLYDRAKLSYIKDKDIRIVLNGIDNENIFFYQKKELIRDKLNIPQDKYILLSVAQNIVERSGKEIAKIAKELPDIEFYLIGSGEKKDYFRDNMHLVGCIKDQPTLAQYYSSADLFLLCSKKETFSMPCAESICCGTPVVGYEAGGPEGIFKEPYASFVRYGDVNAMVNLIKLKLKSNISCEDLMIYGNRFSNKNMCKNYNDIYRELLDRYGEGK